MDWLGAGAVSGIWVNRNKNSFENHREQIEVFWDSHILVCTLDFPAFRVSGYFIFFYFDRFGKQLFF